MLCAAAACVPLTACETPSSSVQVVSEASGSSYFSLGPPGFYNAGTAVRVAGRVCRRYRSTYLSPGRVRIEQLAPGGAVIATAQAGAPPIYAYNDQACVWYGARVAWTLSPGETLRACFDRGHACPANAPAKAVVSVPTAP